MKKEDSRLSLYLVLVAVVTIIVIFFMNNYLGNLLIPQEIVIKTTTSKIVDLDKEKIFDVIADIEKYPTILPQNVISVEIINRTNNIIYANEQVSERGFQVNLLVKHVIEPYEKHTIEILNGDAKNSVITQTYETVESGTKIKTDLEIHLSGILIPFGFTAEHNIIHALNTIFDRFEEYAINE